MPQDCYKTTKAILDKSRYRLTAIQLSALDSIVPASLIIFCGRLTQGVILQVVVGIFILSRTDQLVTRDSPELVTLHAIPPTQRSCLHYAQHQMSGRDTGL